MAEAKVLDRQRAVERYLQGESPTAIYQSLGYSREWFYKWLKRHESGDASWAEERSRRPTALAAASRGGARSGDPGDAAESGASAAVLRRAGHRVGTRRERDVGPQSADDQSGARAARLGDAPTRGVCGEGHALSEFAGSPRGARASVGLRRPLLFAGPAALLQPAQRRSGDRSVWRPAGRESQQSTDPRRVLGDLVAAGDPRASAGRQRNGLLRQPRSSPRAWGR